MEGAKIFHLRAGPHLPGSPGTNGQIHIHSHGALLEPAVTGPQIADDQAQLLQKSHHLPGAAHIRLSDNFYQRYTGTIVVNQSASPLLIMGQFSCILLHVNLMDPDSLLGAIPGLFRRKCFFCRV